MLVCTLYVICLKFSIYDLQEVIGYRAFYTKIVLMLQGYESQDQFISPWFHRVSVCLFNIFIIDHDSAEVGINGSNSQLHFCKQLSA